MTPHDIELVQQSFADIAPIDDEAGLEFYQRLFEIAPDLRALFRGDMDEQGRMFMSMLTVAVNGLGDLERIEPDLADLAIRHVGYGVKPGHYAKVGAALLWLLERKLGAAWTEETRQAWRSVYETLTGIMIEAGYGGGEETPTGIV